MPLYSENIGGVRIIIDNDPHPLNPRTEQDNAATMVCFHSQYNLGDDVSETYTGPVDLVATLTGSDFHEKYKDMTEALNAKENFVWLPVYLYDHSGLSINTTGFSCPWDSGQIGIIYMDAEAIRTEFGDINEDTKKRAKILMTAEVKYYDYYLQGSAYSLSFYKDLGDDHDYSQDDTIESYGGYIGDIADYIAEAKEEARGY